MRITVPLLVLAMACNPASTDATDDTDDTAVTSVTLEWTFELEDDPHGMLMSAWGATEDDIWVVGGQEEAGTAFRGKAGSWTDVTLPAGTPLLTWVRGTAADDVWLGGLEGTLLHWDGSAFEEFSVDIDEAFWGLYPASTDDVLAVGGLFRSQGEAPVAYRFDGTSFSAVSLPDDLPDIHNLFKVAHDGSVYHVVGAGGVALTLDDGGLRTVTTEASEDIVTVFVADGEDPIAVGGRTSGAIHRWNGTGWSQVREVFSGLSGVHMLPGGITVMVGERGSTGVYDPDDDTYTETLTATQDLLHAVWVTPGGTVYAVGGNFYTSGTFEGTMLVSGAD